MKKYICYACPECELWDDDYGCQQEEKGGECPTLETPSINQNPVREMLFRAWDKVSKKYREFDGMHDTMTINEDGKVEYYNLQNGSGGDEYILEQFTGLLDKNGKKIFEGDIVVLSDDTVFPGYRYAISFHDGAFCVGLHDGELFGDFCSIRDGMGQARKYDKEFSICVVGNIHDNPELLEVC